MNHKILANKWRPKIFEDVIGQNHVINTITNSFLINRLHQSYIFSGGRGIGKTTIARLFAKALNCEKNDIGMPCCICNHCKEIEKNNFIDLIEIDAASRTKVEEIRDILDSISYLPAKGRYKIYLIDEVHMLSKHSFNALLKTLEEPPSHVKFFLATTYLQKLPSTIISRCIQFHLKNINSNLIFKKLYYILQKENINTELKALQLISYSANGSMRDALTITDQAISMGKEKITKKIVEIMLGIIDEKKPLLLIETLLKSDGRKVMQLLNEFSILNIDWDAFLVQMLQILHRIAVLQFLKTELELDQDQNFYTKKLKKIASTFPIRTIQSYYQILLIGRKDLELTPDHRMGIEMIFLRILSYNLQKTN